MTDARTLGDHHVSRCPVSHDSGSFTVWGNEQARAVAEDPATFSSHVSRHLNVPNGMDGDEHRRFRRVIDRYLADDVVVPRYPDFERIAVETLKSLGAQFDANDFGSLVAVRCQSAWLGWDGSYEQELLDWVTENQAATRSGDYARTSAVADSFTAIVKRIVEDHREGGQADPTSQLLTDTVEEEDGSTRPLTKEEIVAILRNWTAGDLGSIAFSIGIVAQFLATHHDIADELRRLDAAGNTDSLDRALDEILRIDDPFISNRRTATRDTDIAGQKIPAGSLVNIHWTAANRDPRTFSDPDRYDPEANAPHNLVYGAGPHVCPGRTISTLELRAALVALLRRGNLELASEPVREENPVGGYASVPVRIVATQ